MRNAQQEYLLRGQKQMGPEEQLEYLLILFLCLKVLNVHTTSWTAEVPQTVSALNGSCVVIPCKFNYPDPERNLSDLTGIWQTSNQDHLIYHPDPSKVMEKFRGRTNLVGDLARKNCSLRINHLEEKDNGQFIFRIEIHDFDKYSYKDNVVSIDVQNAPATPMLSVSREVKAGEAVTATCTASHSCPTDLPHLVWSHTGTPIVQSEALPNGQWRVTSNLTFTATPSDHGRHLVCTAQYQHVTSFQQSDIFHVKYPPEIREGSACIAKTTGVACLCTVASEPASEIAWLIPRGTNASSRTERHGSITLGMLLSTQRLTEVTCQASNSQGSSSATFFPPQSDKFQYTSITVVSVLLVAALVILVRLVRRERNSHDLPVTGKDEADTTIEEPSYNMTARKEEKSIDSGFYVNNEQIYSNIEIGEDNDVYSCVEDASN
ncbi:myelin-associated glycoprotein-like isoform X2 [Conger conger]|uniref:myelin-associated glycoprotein-like isoform X2 n=1 Tax=Conger conger TaxID=82655 RepID=UPI002A59F935|nr:myelin-associated glycoprotein-like isoform X2 [Conger conger]